MGPHARPAACRRGFRLKFRRREWRRRAAARLCAVFARAGRARAGRAGAGRREPALRPGGRRKARDFSGVFGPRRVGQGLCIGPAAPGACGARERRMAFPGPGVIGAGVMRACVMGSDACGPAGTALDLWNRARRRSGSNRPGGALWRIGVERLMRGNRVATGRRKRIASAFEMGERPSESRRNPSFLQNSGYSK